MAKKKIVFQGEPGANSDIACREAYPDYQPIPCPTFEDCFSALSSGDVDLGMIPIENSVAGRVADIHHLMPTARLHIVAEWFLPIRNQLMAPKGASLKTIKTVQSHVMALGQCRKVIRELKLKPVVAADTAGSAREVAEAKDITRAAIGSRLAAQIYGLDILKENVEDESNSTTRFVVLSREKNWAKPGNGKTITTFVFRVRNLPAALYKALGGFATNGVNMTKLESYMVGGNFFATQFYADVEGHPDDRALVLALEELAFFSKELTHPRRLSGARLPRLVQGREGLSCFFSGFGFFRSASSRCSFASAALSAAISAFCAAASSPAALSFRLRLARLLGQRLLQKLDIALQAARAPLHRLLGGAKLEPANVLAGRGEASATPTRRAQIERCHAGRLY